MVLRAFVVVIVVVGSNGCQILGCEPRHCQLDDKAGACADGDVCGSDGFCRKIVVELPCGAPPEPAERTLSLSVSATFGVEAMGNELFGVPASIVTDVRGCTVELGRPLCPLEVGQRPRGVVQPLGALSAAGAEAFAPLLSGQALVHAHGSSVDVDDTFAVEVLFRTPTNGGDSLVVTQLGPGGGWGIFMRNGVPLFVAGDRAVALAGQNDGTWRHVLCTVDAAGIAAAAAAATPDAQRDDDEILCVVDGAVAAGASFAFAERAGSLFTAGSAPLTLGDVDDVPGDPAVIVARVWNGDVLDAIGLKDDDIAATENSTRVDIATARIDALAQEARARLARYVGLRVVLDGGGDATFLTGNLDLGFARAQPIEHGRFQRHEFVGGGWPRVAHTAQGLPGLLLEPIRRDLLESAWTACAAIDRVEMLGRAEACNQEDSVLSRAVSVASPGFDDDGSPLPAQLVFSVFGDLANGAPEFVIDGDTVCSTTTPDTPGCEIQIIDDDDDNFVRIVHRFTVDAPATVSFQLRARGLIWSAQLEEGVDPTTPMNGQGAVILDQIFVSAPLAAGASSSLRATVASDGSNIIMAPIAAIDGGALFGRATSLITAAATDELGDEELFFGALTDVEGVQTFIAEGEGDPFPFLGGVPVRGGVDIGAPVDTCPGCTVAPVTIALAGAQSWHTVLFQGVIEPGFLIDGEVLSKGTVPRPTALDVTVAAPAGGCLEHRLADVSFVACETGACSENEQLVWQESEDAPTAAVVVDAPSIDERAVVGVFETALPSTTLEANTAVLFEVRFRRDDGNDDGAFALLSLVDANDEDVLRVDDQDGAAVLATRNGAHTIDAAFGDDAGNGEWAQLTCMLAAGLRCTVNAGAPFDVDVNLSGNAKPVRARVGNGVVPIAFARVWLLPELAAPGLVERDLPGPLADAVVPVAAARLMDARVASSFGLIALPRSGPFTVVETRTSSATIEQGGETHDVGAHWPRVIAGEGGAPVYVAALAGEGLAISGADLATGLGADIAASFESVGQGRFLVLTHDLVEPVGSPELAPVDALALEHVDDNVRVFIDVATDAVGPRELVAARRPFFDGRTLSMTAQLFRFAVSSNDRLTFGTDERGIEGGQTLLLGGSIAGGGVPLTLRTLRVDAE